MLDWLRWLHTPVERAPQMRPAAPTWRIHFDDTHIEVTAPQGTAKSLTWAQLGSVGISTTAKDPAAPDLFWILQSIDRRTSLVFPMGAEGEHELLHAMQANLHGFDNMTVIEAMSSAGAAGFVVWQFGNEAANDGST